MSHWINFLFGLVGYAVGMGGLVLFILFASGWNILLWQIDAESNGPIGHALLINVGLVALFGVQHSVMARPGFKCLWTRIIPKSIERSCYCIATAVVVFLLCYFWQPLAGTVWHVEHTRLRFALTALQLLGWTIVVASSFTINHGNNYKEYRRPVPMIVPNPRGLSPDFLSTPLHDQEYALAVTPSAQR